MSHVDALSDGVAERVESFVTEWLSESHIPGASVALVDGDETVYAEGFGARDLTSNAAATPDTLYGVASVTKSVTALAVLQQVEAGTVALDDPIPDYLPFYEDVAHPPTVEDLLTHSSGIPSDGSSVALISRMIDEDPVAVPLSSERDFERYVNESAAERAAGERFFYSNSGYEVLGRLVSELDGRSFPAYVDDEILGPVGMSRSSLDASVLDDETDAMTPYYKQDGETRATPFPDKGVGAAGGLLSSVTDLARYVRFQFDPDPAVVDPELLRAAWVPHAVRRTRLDGAEQTYGYGWMRQPLLGGDLVDHGGTLAVSAAYVGFLPDQELGVAIGANTTPDEHPMHVGPALLAILRGEDPADAVPYYGVQEKLSRVTGEYESYRGILSASVEQAAGRLELEFDTALSAESVAATPANADPDDLTFHVTTDAGSRVPVRFEEQADGVDMFYERWRLHPA